MPIIPGHSHRRAPLPPSSLPWRNTQMSAEWTGHGHVVLEAVPGETVLQNFNVCQLTNFSGSSTFPVRDSFTSLLQCTTSEGISGSFVVHITTCPPPHSCSLLQERTRGRALPPAKSSAEWTAHGHVVVEVVTGDIAFQNLNARRLTEFLRFDLPRRRSFRFAMCQSASYMRKARHEHRWAGARKRWRAGGGVCAPFIWSFFLVQLQYFPSPPAIGQPAMHCELQCREGRS